MFLLLGIHTGSPFPVPTTQRRSCASYVSESESGDEKGAPFICREHKLGIAMWCIPDLYRFATDLFVSLMANIDFKSE